MVGHDFQFYSAFERSSLTGTIVALARDKKNATWKVIGIMPTIFQKTRKFSLDFDLPSGHRIVARILPHDHVYLTSTANKKVFSKDCPDIDIIQYQTLVLEKDESGKYTFFLRYHKSELKCDPMTLLISIEYNNKSIELFNWTATPRRSHNTESVERNRHIFTRKQIILSVSLDLASDKVTTKEIMPPEEEIFKFTERKDKSKAKGVKTKAPKRTPAPSAKPKRRKSTTAVTVGTQKKTSALQRSAPLSNGNRGTKPSSFLDLQQNSYNWNGMQTGVSMPSDVPIENTVQFQLFSHPDPPAIPLINDDSMPSVAGQSVDNIFTFTSNNNVYTNASPATMYADNSEQTVSQPPTPMLEYNENFGSELLFEDFCWPFFSANKRVI